MHLYEVLQDMSGSEVELFENRNTGRLEIRPAAEGRKTSISGRYIGDVGEDYVVIEVKTVGGTHFDAYPFSQIVLRDWDDRLAGGRPSRKKAAQPETGTGGQSQGPSRQRDQEWLK
ncbi:MAG: hypothetical protein R6U89_03470 [Dehalococcoidia bacterium]